ncbi:Protein N-acetyltransferase, RimJ/RimL family [Streptomyces sp. 2323.1]|uniref:GNAT family N-acetyltransferase n=1 Tax=Streptomyces sp. 2323.1 TaxID=1938841 RepID=UPI000BBF7CC9|nr:GNAT family N-acetyltransferase [Streptomyces sp. 2323.1]SOE13599.1 Protein N-acetyltransferase, RimJ/RimL family [Streptomyces sp. 2323.1]
MSSSLSPHSRAPQGSGTSPYCAAAPDLRTERLLLRPWSDGDLAAVLDGTRQPHWAADFPADGDRVIAGYTAGQPAARGAYGQRQILERESGLVVGAIGLFWPPADGSVEFGYGIVPSRRGRGYASEAARALVAFAFTAPGVHTVRAKIERSNPASGRVLEKAGLERWSSDDTHVHFHLTAPAPA